jgi:hypothetical protein
MSRGRGRGLVEYETSKLVSDILGPVLLAPCHWSLQRALTVLAARAVRTAHDRLYACLGLKVQPNGAIAINEVALVVWPKTRGAIIIDIYSESSRTGLRKVRVFPVRPQLKSVRQLHTVT